MTTLDVALREAGDRALGATAIVHGSLHLAYGDLLADVASVAAGLRRLDPGARQAVLLLLPAGADFIRAFFAVLSCGAVPVPLNPALRGPELSQLAAETGARIAIAAGPPALAGGPACPGEGLPAAQAARAYRLTGGGAGQQRPGPAALPDGVAAVFYTSGTTGRAKGVLHTHSSLIESVRVLEALRREFFGGVRFREARRLATALATYRLRLLKGLGDQVWLTPLPPHGIAGFRILLQSLLSGHRLVVMDGFHPEGALRLIASEQVSIFASAPSMLEAMLAVPGGRRYDVSSLAVIGLGSAPARPDLVRAARARFGCPVVIGYGSTETGGGLLVTRLGDGERQAAETVGRPFPNARIAIVDEGGRELPPGQVGELVCQAPSLMAGYLGGTGRAASLDGEGWYHTGDLATAAADGSVRIVGRKSDCILRGGHLIVPAEVETVLEGHPGVLRAAVVGVPHRFAGETAWAFVVPKTGTPPRGGELRRHCAAHLTLFKVPDHIRVVDRLPLTESGEVMKHALREMVMAERSAAEGSAVARLAGTGD